MKKLAIIGASYLQRPLVEKAKEMGLYTICFAWAEGAVCKDWVDEFYPISIVDKDEILKVCQEKQIDGICTIASDVAAPTVAYVSEKMGLFGNSYQASVTANNKYAMRQAFMNAGVPCPNFLCVEDSADATTDKIENSMKLPLIVKPADRSGSLGVTKVETIEELKEAIDNALTCSFKKQAMVEEFVGGREISVEFISYQGKHYPLQITDKVTTGAPHFVELEHHQPSTLSAEMYAEIYAITENALNALGITNGASHSEYKITDNGEIFVIEIGGRMGGDFIGSDLVRLSTGYDFVKGVIDVALGEFTKPVLNRCNFSGVKFIYNDSRDLTCSADRLGYYIYRSQKPNEEKLQEKILIIGAGAGQVPLIREANSRGLYTMVVSIDGDYPGINEADVHIIADIFDKKLILEISKLEKIQYILSDQSDFAVPTVAYVAENMGLLGNSIETAEIFTNKKKQRDFCMKYNFRIPKTYSIKNYNEVDDIPYKFPLVIKPVDSQGSRGISMSYTKEELKCAVIDALKHSKTKHVIVEEFFEGREVVCEGWVMNGKYYNIAFADRKYFKISNKFIPSQTIFPSSIANNIKEQIVTKETYFVKKSNVKFGIIHSEYLINDNNEFCLVETALRGGGVYISSHLIPISSNIDLTKLLLDYTLFGKEKAINTLQQIHLNKHSAYICFYLKKGVITNVIGLEDVKSHPQVIQADIDEYIEGFKYENISHKGDRLGPILVVADSNNQLEEITDWLHNTYKIFMNNTTENAIVWE